MLYDSNERLEFTQLIDRWLKNSVVWIGLATRDLFSQDPKKYFPTIFKSFPSKNLFFPILKFEFFYVSIL